MPIDNVRHPVKTTLGAAALLGLALLLVIIAATEAYGGIWLPGQEPSEPVSAPHELDQMYRPSISTLPAMKLPAPPKPKPTPHVHAAPPAATGDVWGKLRNCESSDGRTSSNGLYHGYFQFHMGTWRANGGTGHPMDHSYEHQKKIAQNVLASQGWGAWPHCSRELGLR